MASLLLVDGAIPAGAAGSELVMVTLMTQTCFDSLSPSACFPSQLFSWNPEFTQS